MVLVCVCVCVCVSVCGHICMVSYAHAKPWVCITSRPVQGVEQLECTIKIQIVGVECMSEMHGMLLSGCVFLHRHACTPDMCSLAACMHIGDLRACVCV
jgi:hypothetical protein